MNILHRDMKLENILIDYNTKKVKLIDFGYSVEIDPAIKA
jgi:MAP/microtubule affinity-regulating kinase